MFKVVGCSLIKEVEGLGFGKKGLEQLVLRLPWALPQWARQTVDHRSPGSARPVACRCTPEATYYHYHVSQFLIGMIVVRVPV